MFYKSKISNILLIRKDLFGIKDRKIILENINLSSKVSSSFILKGKNGSGKTSLISYLNKFYLKLVIKNNINLFLLFFNIINSSYLNVFKYSIIYLIQNKIEQLSYGYNKLIFFILNYLIKTKIYLFDEPFNGLDKYFLKFIDKFLRKVDIINSIKIKSYHNILRTNKFITIFLD